MSEKHFNPSTESNHSEGWKERNQSCDLRACIIYVHDTRTFTAPYLAINLLTACLCTDATYVYVQRSLKACGAFTDQR